MRRREFHHACRGLPLLLATAAPEPQQPAAESTGLGTLVILPGASTPSIVTRFEEGPCGAPRFYRVGQNSVIESASANGEMQRIYPPFAADPGSGSGVGHPFVFWPQSK